MINGLNYEYKNFKRLSIYSRDYETDGVWNGTNNSINKSIGIMIPDDIRCVSDEGTILSNIIMTVI